jgi:hypothetical protein
MQIQNTTWPGIRAFGLMLCILPGLACAQMKYVETEHLRLIYFTGTDYLVPYATQSFVNALLAQKARFGYVPDGKAAVLLQDFSDSGNAVMMTTPSNRIFYDIAPVGLTFETFSPGERLYTFANHETVHFVTGDGASTSDMKARRWLGGKVVPVAEHPESIFYTYLTNPRNTSPRWFQEGGAVFMETWEGGGLGRAQGGYDEMVFRAMVRDDASFYDPLGLVSKGTEVDFQVGANAYLYGTRFMSYLALQYSPEQLVDWMRRSDGTHSYYARDFQRVFGRPLDQAWQDWIAWEHAYQQANLTLVREHPITPYKEIARRGLGALSRAFYSADKQTLYAGVRYPGRVPHLVSISLADGTVTELAEIKGAVGYRVTSLAHDPSTQTLFYTTDNLGYRNLMAYDIKSGKSRMLFKAARIGDLAFNAADRSLWGLRTNNGFAMLVRLAYPYDEWKSVHVFPFGEVPFDVDISADGKNLSYSLAGPDESRAGVQTMQLRVSSIERLLAGDVTPSHRLELGNAVPEGFVFSADGRYLYGSSYYTGVSNIYRYELATSKLEALSNAEVGYFRPVPIHGNKLLIFHYTAQGFVPATIEAQPTEDLSAINFLGEQIATKHPVVQSWGAGPPSQVNYDSEVRRQGEYEPYRQLARESIYPVVEGYKDSVAFGGHARFSDPIGMDGLNLTLSYSPDSSLESKERMHASLVYRHALWSVGVKWNAGDFYDLFGPTKRSREGYSAFVNYEHAFIYDLPETLSLVARLAYFGDLDALPGFQNVPSPTDRLGEAQVGFVYKYPRASIGKVDDETGHLWSVLAHLYEAEGEFTPSLLGKFDVGWPLPISHSSIWLRTAAGFSTGDRADPLANAYFGGFRNNYVDNGDAKRYREFLSMPGFEIDSLNGKSYAKSMVEWNLPPLRFDHLGQPGFYASWLRPALFGTALVTNLDSADARVHSYNVGLQFDVQLQVMHRLPMMLSFGYARGFEGDGAGEDEFMLSFKVL